MTLFCQNFISFMIRHMEHRQTFEDMFRSKCFKYMSILDSNMR
jgi:hypothetical protein